MRTARVCAGALRSFVRLDLVKSKRRSLLISVVFVLLLQSSPFAFGVRAVASAPESYIVAPGDTLSGIAERFGISQSTLERINGIRSPDFLRVGQVLVLESSSPRPRPQRTHVVMLGETLTDIAEAHSVSIEEIAEANGLTDQDFILPGQILVIPDGRQPSQNAETRDVVREAAMKVPYRTQFDGTRYEESNCGPATLGMLMSYYGQEWSSDDLRRSVNKSTGYWGLDGGSDWESLVYAAEARGFHAKGLYEGPKRYRKWTIDEALQEVQKGLPVMLLVRYPFLPGHERDGWWGDHYIVFLGLTSDGDVIYHDSAFRGAAEGAYRTMSKNRLLRAWAGTSVGIKYSAMSLEWLGN